MRPVVFAPLAFILGCSVSIPDGRLTCAADEDCPPGYGCAAGHCYAPGTDAGLDGGVDAPPDVPRDVPRDVPADVPPDSPDAGPPEVPVEVACGVAHTCVRTSFGRVFCWGDDNQGAVGDADGIARTTAVTTAQPVDGLPLDTTIEGLALGDGFTCALDDGTAVYCWGSNANGRLGTDDTATNAPRPLLTELGDIRPVALAAGGNHACALSTSSSLHCWGSDNLNQLGDGVPGTGQTDLPIETFVGTAFRAITAGSLHTCALGLDSSIHCWGHNYFHQLATTASPPGTGLFDSSEGALTVAVPGDPAIGTLVGMGLHTCVQAADGLHCWGWNGLGQLGTASPDRLTVPTLVALPGLPTSSAGADESTLLTSHGHTCAIVARELYCWGSNRFGELGAGAVGAGSPMPVRVGLSEVTAVATGPRHTCAIAADVVYCWGANENGRLGVGDESGRERPEPVLGLP